MRRVLSCLQRGLLFVLVSVVCLALLQAEEADRTWKFKPEQVKPFWQTKTMQGESLLFVQGASDELPNASLLFAPTKVLSVRSASHRETYKEGKDYTWKPGDRVIRVPKGSRIVVKKPSDLRRPAGSQRHRLTHRDGAGEILFGATHEYHDMQTVITYQHSGDEWTGPSPSYAGERVRRVVAKLKARESVAITLLGDSISTGCNASLWADVAPYQPPYQDLVVQHLRTVYGSEVELTNLSVGGRDSAWGVTMADKVVASKPDLVILAFGMNDAARRPAAEFQQNTAKMIKAVRAELPHAEFILVATMLGNADWTYLQADLFPQYRDALAGLCGEGIVLADMTSMWAEFLKAKKDWDLTGNGVNHPNDFGHRVYAQVLSALLVE